MYYFQNKLIKFVSLANLDIDDVKIILKQTEQQLVVFLDILSIKPDVAEYFDIQLEVELSRVIKFYFLVRVNFQADKNSELYHFHGNFSFIYFVENVYEFPSHTLDLAEKLFLIKPSCLKHWLLLLSQVCPGAGRIFKVNYLYRKSYYFRTVLNKYTCFNNIKN